MRVFVIAMECEAQCVRPHLKEGDRLIVCGIGKVNAAAAAQKAISEFGADIIVNAGLAGGFGAEMNPGEVYEVSAAVEYDFDLSKLNGTAVGVLDEYDSPYLEAETVGLFPSRILATGDHFNDSEADYTLIRDVLGAGLRDMEGAAIAHVCKKNGVKFRSLKCVTNVAGRGSMTGQYENSKSECLAILTESLGRYLAV
jgi:adenosylhomocysteine nucleosidase